MTESICACDPICVEQRRDNVKASPQSGTFWGRDAWQLIETIAAFVSGCYGWYHEVQPTFSNGGVRVLFRPDRIDLA
jgi:hypothetical protein